MASTLLYTRVTQNFNAPVAGASGTTIQWTYTVPPGKRAIVAHILAFVANNGNATNTTIADILVTNIAVMRAFSDVANNTQASMAQAPRSFLQAGDTLIGRTINGGAAAVTMQVSAIIEEYG